MYLLTWGKNGLFCRNEFLKIIFFGKKSVIFQIIKWAAKVFHSNPRRCLQRYGWGLHEPWLPLQMLAVFLYPLLHSQTRARDHTDHTAHGRVIGLDLWRPRFKESCDAEWNCSPFYWWNWSLERRGVCLKRKIYKFFFKRGCIIPTHWSHIYTCTTKETSEKYYFIEDTYIKLFHFQLKYCAGISHCVCLTKYLRSDLNIMFEKLMPSF